MSVLNKFNQGNQFQYDNTVERDFTSPKEMMTDKVYPIHAMFINTKSKFGKAPVIFTDVQAVNAPSHMVDIVEQMISDDEVVQLINDRKAGFKIYEYKNKFGLQYGIEFVEI